MWVGYGLIAISFQITRTALQKDLTKAIPRIVVTWIRYAFGLPFIIVFYVVLLVVFRQKVIAIAWPFWIFATLGALLQIVATNLLLKLFTMRSFVVGTCYGKSDSIQTAVLGYLFFAESLNVFELFIIVAGFGGVLLMSLEKNAMSIRAFFDIRKNESAKNGILTGMLFSLTALCIRQAILHVDASTTLMASSTTLIFVVFLQVLLFFVYLFQRRRPELKAIRGNVRASLFVGLSSCIGSVFWFMAFASAYAAYVKALAQLQMPLSILYSYLFFKEKIYRHEVIGMLIIIASVTLLVLL